MRQAALELHGSQLQLCWPAGKHLLGECTRRQVQLHMLLITRCNLVKLGCCAYYNLRFPATSEISQALLQFCPSLSGPPTDALRIKQPELHVCMWSAPALPTNGQAPAGRKHHKAGRPVCNHWLHDTPESCQLPDPDISMNLSTDISQQAQIHFSCSIAGVVMMLRNVHNEADRDS